jgi:hypothetical protein
MAEMKYYHALNASQPVKAGNVRIRFECYELCGTWMGVYATDNPEHAASLSELASQTNSIVEEISREEYEKNLKKKQPELSFSVPSQQSQESFLKVEVASPAEALDTMPSSKRAIGVPVESVQDALIIGYIGKPEAK